MTKPSRKPKAQADDTEVELASPPCLINEVDPAYMGLDVAEGRAAAGKKPGKPGGRRRRNDEVS